MAAITFQSGQGPQAGSYIQGGQVYNANGTPLTYQGGPVYSVNGGYSTTPPGYSAPSTNTTPTTLGAPPTGYAPPVINQTFAPNQTGASYVPPEVNALQNIYKIDPNTADLMNWLPKAYGRVGTDYFKQLKNAEAGILPQGVQREITQQVAGNQAATGNTEGVAQAAEQAMTTGTAGLQYLQNALSQAQGYLGNTSGYIQGGSTPYAMGTGYVNNALNQQSASLTGSPVYQPATTGVNPYMYLNPMAGNQFAQNTVGFMNAGTGATAGSPDTAGPLIGSAISAIGSALGGLAMCWVAREILGTSNDDWKLFREWMLNEAPEDFRAAYLKNGAALALWLQDRPDVKDRLRPFMQTIVRHEKFRSSNPSHAKHDVQTNKPERKQGICLVQD